MVLYRSDIRIIFKDLFTALTFIGIMFVAPALVSLFYGEYGTIPVFLSIGILVSAVSYAISRFIGMEGTTEFRHALIVVALLWLFAALLSAIPFMLILKMSFLDSFFEAMSAWTTTGFTVIGNLEAVPYSLLFWRSFMQWIGGIGIVFAVLGGVFKLGNSLFFAEARDEKIKPNVINTIKTIWWIYLFYTGMGILFLVIFGMPIFDSINHAMTAISTGGMTVRNTGIAAYDSLNIELTIMALMLFGAISFLSHYYLLKGKLREFIRDVQLKSLAIILFLAVLLLLPSISLREAIFQIFSASTACGFSTVNLSLWGDFAKFILILLMIIGGCAGSTSGGLKIIRVDIFVKSVSWKLRKLLTPHVIISRRIGKRFIKNKEIRLVFMFILLYISFIFIGSSVLAGLGFDGTDSVFEAASAQGNVGLTTGIVSGNLHYSGKIMLIINMWIGRLEIWAILILIGSIFIRR